MSLAPRALPIDRVAGGVGSGERQKNVTGEVTARGPCPGQPQRDPSGQRLALSRQQGRVSWDDGDDLAGTGRRLETEVDLEPVAVERDVVEQIGADMPSGDGQFGA
jgi:hypothetical protein